MSIRYDKIHWGKNASKNDCLMTANRFFKFYTSLDDCYILGNEKLRILLYTAIIFIEETHNLQMQDCCQYLCISSDSKLHLKYEYLYSSYHSKDYGNYSRQVCFVKIIYYSNPIRNSSPTIQRKFTQRSLDNGSWEHVPIMMVNYIYNLFLGWNHQITEILIKILSVLSRCYW